MTIAIHTKNNNRRRYTVGFRRSLLIVVCVPALLVDSAFAYAVTDLFSVNQDPPAPNPETPPPPPAQDTIIRTAPPIFGVPAGFEDLQGPLETLFDVYFQGRRIGASPGRLDSGQFTFLDAQGLSARLPNTVAEQVLPFLSQPLASNEELRCLPGQTEACGVLPSGLSGVIVNPDSFRVDIYLGREFLVQGVADSRLLGAPISGPSIIQNITGSVSAGGAGEENVRYGLALDTLASLGRTSAVSRILGDNQQGLQLEEGYAQHYRDTRRYAGGLFRSQSSVTLNSLKLYGVEVSSFNGTVAGEDQYTATPIDVVLPRESRVEIYRDGTLLAASQYGSGLQVLDTRRLPTGSYPIRIVARDASGIVLDEVRTFTKAGDLPPPGRTIYSFQAGVRADDGFSGLLIDDGQQPFVPDSSGESVFSATASRRIGASTAATLGLTSVDGDLYPEAGFQLYRGDLRAAVAAAVGPDSQFATLGSVSFQYRGFTGNLGARFVESVPVTPADLDRLTRYRPFLQSEDTVFGSLQTRAFGGSVGFRGSYSRSDFADERYIVAANYNRSLGETRLGNGIFSVEAIASDVENRIGFRLTFLRGLGRNSSLTGAVGGEYISERETGGDGRGIYPIAQIGYNRFGEYRNIAVSGGINGGFSNGDALLQLSGGAASRLGDVDISAGVTRARQSNSTDTYFTGNVRTGFVYGGGVFQPGARGLGDAAVLVEISDPTESATEAGRFRVVVDDLPYDAIRVGQRATIALPAFTRPRIGLAPEAAPPFDIDLTPREVPLYPGNVVKLDWTASRVVTLYGRLVDAQGFPLSRAIVQTGTDLAVTSDQGYFSISGPVGSTLTARRSGGVECGIVAMITEAQDKNRSVVRLGDIVCVVSSPEQ